MKSRRKFIGSVAAGLCAGVIPGTWNDVLPRPLERGKETENFLYCLNTVTIRGQKLGLLSDIEIAAKAGYDGVELWFNDIQRYLAERGSKRVLKQKIKDAGLSFENTIAFSPWIVDDPAIRTAALNEFESSLELLAELGCKRIAAPPSGATKGMKLDLFDIAERYNSILELGEEYGVTPVLELWGHSANLHALGQVMFVITESKHCNAAILPDVYHLFRGGSDFSGLKLLNERAVSMFHLNDYPIVPARADLTDSDRVFPGDGGAPFPLIMKELKRINPEMVLSLELFNPEYWKMDALMVAEEGLKKMKEVVHL